MFKKIRKSLKNIFFVYFPPEKHLLGELEELVDEVGHALDECATQVEDSRLNDGRHQARAVGAEQLLDALGEFGHLKNTIFFNSILHL
jgi:hypothetical protein